MKVKRCASKPVNCFAADDGYAGLFLCTSGCWEEDMRNDAKNGGRAKEIDRLELPRTEWSFAPAVTKTCRTMPLLLPSRTPSGNLLLLNSSFQCRLIAPQCVSFSPLAFSVSPERGYRHLHAMSCEAERGAELRQWQQVSFAHFIFGILVHDDVTLHMPSKSGP